MASCSVNNSMLAMESIFKLIHVFIGFTITLKQMHLSSHEFSVQNFWWWVDWEQRYFDGLVQDCSNFIADALEL